MEKIQIIYDVRSTPGTTDMQEVYNIFDKSGMLLYDSHKGDKPQLISEDAEVEIIDVNQQRLWPVEE